MERNYMNLTVTLFHRIQIWGSPTLCRKLWTGIVLLWILSGSVVFFCTIVVSWGNYQQMANAGIFSMAMMKIFLSILHVVIHKEMIMNLVYMMRKDFEMIEKELNPPLGFQSNIKVEKLNHIGMKIILGMTTTAVSMFAVIPLVLKLKSDTTEEDVGGSLPVRIALPYNLMSLLGYNSAYAYEMVLLTFGPFCSYAVSCVYITFMTHIINRFKNLHQVLKNITKNDNNIVQKSESSFPANEKNIENKISKSILKDEENFEKGKVESNHSHNESETCLLCKNKFMIYKVKTQLRMCIRYHQELLRFCKEFDDFCGPQLAIDLMAGMTILCVIGFQLSVLPSVEFRFIVYLLAGLFNCVNILIHCWLNAELEYQSGAVAAAATECNSWDNFDNDAKQWLLIIISRAIKPVSITMYKIFTVNISTFFQVMKVAYSNYALLRELNYEKQTEIL